MLSGSEILQLLVVKRWGEARGGRGEEEGGVSGEKGLVGLDARAHWGWAWPLGEDAGSGGGFGRHPRVLPSRGEALNGPGNTPDSEKTCCPRGWMRVTPQRTGARPRHLLDMG